MPACAHESTVEAMTAAALTKSPIEYRAFQPGDEASFLRLNEEWIVRHFVLEDKDRAVLGDPVKYILEPGGWIIFATMDGEAVGCCALAPTEPGVFEVAKMAVTESRQGRGIGRAILERIIAQAKKMGARKLYLETNSRLPTATRLYSSIGFQHVPPERLKPSLYARADTFMEMLLER
jgi:putative acetyltransferase